jgi:hypothetical protein
MIEVQVVGLMKVVKCQLRNAIETLILVEAGLSHRSKTLDLGRACIDRDSNENSEVKGAYMKNWHTE